VLYKLIPDASSKNFLIRFFIRGFGSEGKKDKVHFESGESDSVEQVLAFSGFLIKHFIPCDALDFTVIF
jgi:hypothetical protein